MTRRNPGPWMWGEAVDLLEQAERLQRQFFRLAGGAEQARWEPPVDVFADGDEILVEVALPGVPRTASSWCAPRASWWSAASAACRGGSPAPPSSGSKSPTGASSGASPCRRAAGPWSGRNSPTVACSCCWPAADRT